jgi:hypothetical protein
MSSMSKTNGHHHPAADLACECRIGGTYHEPECPRVGENAAIKRDETKPRKARARAKKARKQVTQAGWWATASDDGASVHVPGVQQNRWFAARAIGVQLINDARIKRDPKAEPVSQDGVMMAWVEAEAEERKAKVR